MQNGNASLQVHCINFLPTLTTNHVHCLRLLFFPLALLMHLMVDKMGYNEVNIEEAVPKHVKDIYP